MLSTSRTYTLNTRHHVQKNCEKTGTKTWKYILYLKNHSFFIPPTPIVIFPCPFFFSFTEEKWKESIHILSSHEISFSCGLTVFITFYHFVWIPRSDLSIFVFQSQISRLLSLLEMQKYDRRGRFDCERWGRLYYERWGRFHCETPLQKQKCRLACVEFGHLEKVN